jgi:hypothetical protein
MRDHHLLTITAIHPVTLLEADLAILLEALEVLRVVDRVAVVAEVAVVNR